MFSGVANLIIPLFEFVNFILLPNVIVLLIFAERSTKSICEPIDILFEPLISFNASLPIPILFIPVVLLFSAPGPIAILSVPVVFILRVSTPTAVFN